MKIGVLGLQGAVAEHIQMLKQCGCETTVVKTPDQLGDLDGLVIPGGESTTIGKLMERYQLLEPLKQKIGQGMPVFGTCAGLVLLAKDIENSVQHRIGVMDIKVKRNGFGSQRDSFETDLILQPLGEEPYKAVFIRAPYINEVKEGVDILATYDDKIVAAQQGQILVTAFHPELTDDCRFHQYFINTIQKNHTKGISLG